MKCNDLNSEFDLLKQIFELSVRNREFEFV